MFIIEISNLLLPGVDHSKCDWTPTTNSRIATRNQIRLDSLSYEIPTSEYMNSEFDL